MTDQDQPDTILDVFVIGGGVNGTGIARDAAGRGLKVALAEMNDLASATSSASTKLFHGGLRYLEYWEFALVRHALEEREVLLKMMPHISWPMRFVLPYHRDMRFEGDTPTSKLLGTVMPWMKGRRPAWLIRLGLMMYDRLGGREILAGTETLDLRNAPEGAPLDDKFQTAYEYSDCWVEDSRLVVLNARDAAEKGAQVMTRTRVTSAEREGGHWRIVTEGDGEQQVWHAKVLVNAGGPWVEEIVTNRIRVNSTEGIRLVRGSHIVTKKLFDHDKAYFFQGEDGRIIFAIPYETDFTLIGTTDQEHDSLDKRPVATETEQDYLIEFASSYLKAPVTRDDVVWTYSGVRPLYDDGASSATAATRDYVLSMNEDGPPLLSIFGGKITTYRRLSEQALGLIVPYFPDSGGDWTKEEPLPGGDFEYADKSDRLAGLRTSYPWLGERWSARLFKAYGTDARKVLAGATSPEDLGQDFGATLTEAEVRWLMTHEFARTAEDVIWRRSKLGLRLDDAQIAALDGWMAKARTAQTEDAT